MKKIILSIVLFIISTSQALSHTGHSEIFKSLEYELFRNNKSIGYHNYKFERKNSNLIVKSIIEFNIVKLGINLYSYEAVSLEEYKKDQLINFSSKTDQNKKIKNTEITFDDKKKVLIVSGSENQLISPKEYNVGTWWNHEIVQAKAQISAISGRIIEQKVIFLGKEKLTLYGKTFNALRFNFTSSDETLNDNKKLNTDVWYEEKTNIWLKAAFDKRGYWEYRLKVKN